MALGVLTVAAAFLEHPMLLIWVLLGGTLLLLGIIVVYSYLVWKG